MHLHLITTSGALVANQWHPVIKLTWWIIINHFLLVRSTESASHLFPRPRSSNWSVIAMLYRHIISPQSSPVQFQRWWVICVRTLIGLIKCYFSKKANQHFKDSGRRRLKLAPCTPWTTRRLLSARRKVRPGNGSEVGHEWYYYYCNTPLCALSTIHDDYSVYCTHV